MHEREENTDRDKGMCGQWSFKVSVAAVETGHRFISINAQPI